MNDTVAHIQQLLEEATSYVDSEEYCGKTSDGVVEARWSTDGALRVRLYHCCDFGAADLPGTAIDSSSHWTEFAAFETAEDAAYRWCHKGRMAAHHRQRSSWANS